MFPAGAGNTGTFLATIREKGYRLAFASQHTRDDHLRLRCCAIRTLKKQSDSLDWRE